MNLFRSTHVVYLVIAFLALSACSGGNSASDPTTPDQKQRLHADAGPDQSLSVGTFVTLNGSKSTNANQTGLTYKWTLVKPTGSNATLSNDTSVTPTLTVDVEGTYEATLVVTDARQTNLSSEPDSVQVTAAKSDPPPTADAGKHQDVFVNRPVSLDGSGSRASGNKQLTFNWSFKDRPTGSASSLSDPTKVNPSFTPDQIGGYVLQLIVNDGTKSSTAAEVTITAAVKPRPTADAGPDQSVIQNSLVTLDGSKSKAADNGPLEFSWSLLHPDFTLTIPTDGSTKSPTFIANQLGTYVAQLVVTDGTIVGDAKTVKIKVSSKLPIAKTAETISARLCQPVELDGSASTNRDGNKTNPSLSSYRWTLVSDPTGIAELTNATTVKAQFTPYLPSPSDYQVNLVVGEVVTEPGKDPVELPSSPAPVTITTTTNYSNPLSRPSRYSVCDGCHRVGVADTQGPSNPEQELSKKGRKRSGAASRDIWDAFPSPPAVSPISDHAGISLSDPDMRDLCDFFQAN